MNIHPIETKSYEILNKLVDLNGIPPLSREIVSRIIHSTGDITLKDDIVSTEEAVESGIRAIKNKYAMVVDSMMLKASITKYESNCFISSAEPNESGFPTRSAQGMQLGLKQFPKHVIIVVGTAPTALEAALDLIERGECEPELIIAMPVGFVGAQEAKEHLRALTKVKSISNSSARGGAAMAGAAMNAILRLSEKRT